MIYFQVGLLAFGLVSGFLFARQLRRTPVLPQQRARALAAFSGGFAAWIAFAVIALSGPVRWSFLGAAVAIYLPCLLAISSPPKTAASDL